MKGIVKITKDFLAALKAAERLMKPMTAGWLTLAMDKSEFTVEVFGKVFSKTTFPCQVEESGSAMLNKQNDSVAKAIESFKDSEITIATNGDRQIRFSDAETTCFVPDVETCEKDTWRFRGLNGNSKSVNLDGKVFSDLIKKTYACMCRDVTRQNLYGINFEFGNYRVMATSTDGHRLATVGAMTESDFAGSVFVPASLIEEARKTRENVTIRFGKIEQGYSSSQIEIETGNVLIGDKDENYRFPDWRNFLDRKENKLLVIYDYEKFSKAVTAAVRQKIHPITINIDERNMTISGGCNIWNIGKTGGIKTFEVRIDPKYLADLLAIVSDPPLVFAVRDGQSFIQYVENNFTYTIMPVNA